MRRLSRVLPGFIALAALLSLSTPSLANGNQSYSWQPKGSLLLVQADGDDAYDPFADYSEFEESMDEEEDLNFFRNGRLLTVGFLVGYRGWTQTLNRIQTGSPTFGLFMAYFFDLRFAMQVGYLTSDHQLAVPATANSSAINGAISISDISLNFKYYFNTQNVTRGLADLNPYAVMGFSQVYRTFITTGTDRTSKDSAFAFDIGGGIEFPIMRNRMYFGAQFMYQLINFPGEDKEFIDADDRVTGIAPRGDSWNLLGILGTNF